MKIQPFNFETFTDGSSFLSNDAGFHSFLEKNQLISLIDTGTTGHPEIDKQLESKLFISSEDLVDLTSAAIGSAMGKSLMQQLSFRPIFMVVPTLRCDHSCRYCQVSRASITAKDFDLDESFIPHIIDSIKLLSTPPYKIEIQGGEPLLRFDLIKLIYEQAESILFPDTFEMVIASSLSLLDEEMLEWAKPKKVIFSTSLDGDQLVHDRNRILSTNSSYLLASEAIKRIQRTLGPNRVSTVTTVTDALLDNPDSILKAHLELGLNDLFIRPISPYGFAKNKSSPVSYSMTKYLSFYEKLLVSIEKYNKEGASFVEHSAAIHLKRVFNPGFSHYADLKSPSGVILNCILFNYDGKVYGSDESRMLQKVFKDVNFSAGPIEKPEFVKSDYYRTVIAQSFNFNQPGCDTCAFQPFCGSDPCQNISMQGEPVGDKSLSTFCQYHKGMFRLLLNHISSNNSIGNMLNRWSHV